MLRTQAREVHRRLDQGLASWVRLTQPAAPQSGSRVVALYVHAATVEDVTIQSLLRGIPPLFATEWAGKGPARYSTTDLEPLYLYARQVFAATDVFLAEMTTEDLCRSIDLSRVGGGEPPVLWVVSNFVVLELAEIVGQLTSAVEAAAETAR